MAPSSRVFLRYFPLPAIAVLLVAGFLAACELAPRGSRYAEMRFDHLPPIYLDVAEIQFEDRHEPSFEPPRVEHLFPVEPSAAARSWSRDRLRAEGSSGRAVFTVLDGSVVEEALERTTGLRGAFTRDQSERYTARLRASLRQERGGDVTEITVDVRRSTTVAENASLADRERTWYELVERLMQDVNAQLEQSVQRNLNARVPSN